MANGIDLINSFKLETWLASGLTTHRIPVRNAVLPGRYHIERWKRESKVAGGGYGMVWKEQSQPGNRVRAVKEVDKHIRGLKLNHHLHELLAMASCSQESASFVNFHGWYETESQIFIAMEFLELGDLENHVLRALPEHEAQDIIAQVTRALHFMHQKDIAHRDIKPRNILVRRTSPEWWVKVGDFGISKRVRGSGKTSAMKTLFAGPFLAPEQDASDDEESEGTFVYDRAVDIWALGHVAHWLLTFSSPFFRAQSGSFRRYRRGIIGFPLTHLEQSKASSQAIDFITQCMMIKPNDRPLASNAVCHPWVSDQAVQLSVPEKNPRSFRSPPQTANVSYTHEQTIVYSHAQPKYIESLDVHPILNNDPIPNNGLYVYNDSIFNDDPNVNDGPIGNDNPTLKDDPALKDDPTLNDDRTLNDDPVRKKYQIDWPTKSPARISQHWPSKELHWPSEELHWPLEGPHWLSTDVYPKAMRTCALPTSIGQLPTSSLAPPLESPTEPSRSKISSPKADHGRTHTEAQPARTFQCRPRPAWSVADDRQLIDAKAEGMTFQEIANTYFPNKTDTACRKRYARLIERARKEYLESAVDTDRLAAAYTNLRDVTWQPIAQELGVRWELVEAKDFMTTALVIGSR